jgi:hypothetical protein
MISVDYWQKPIFRLGKGRQKCGYLASKATLL